jgi:hypothetical protein
LIKKDLGMPLITIDSSCTNSSLTPNLSIRKRMVSTFDFSFSDKEENLDFDMVSGAMVEVVSSVEHGDNIGLLLVVLGIVVKEIDESSYGVLGTIGEHEIEALALSDVEPLASAVVSGDF